MRVRDKSKIVFILGSPRSGSTLLGRLLGQVDGCSFLGELQGIWTPLFEEGVLCGCRTPFKCCPFWTGVFERAFGGMERVDPRMKQIRASTMRLRKLPLLLCPLIGRTYREDLKNYSRAVGAICRAAQEVSGCRVLVESSKYIRDCIILNSMQDFELHVVHLVRDCRGVANSLLKKKVRPQFLLRRAFMHQLSLERSTRDWMMINILCEAARPCFKHFTRIQYEDLAADPRGTLKQIFSAIGEPEPSLDFLEAQMARLCTGHTVAGNPMRFEDGPVQIKPDLEWTETLAKHQQAIVLARTWPLMMYYGYLRGRQPITGRHGGESHGAASHGWRGYGRDDRRPSTSA